MLIAALNFAKDATKFRRKFGVLTHLSKSGTATVPGMVDVGAKDKTSRSATAEAIISVPAEAAARAFESDVVKTALFSTAITAGIMGAKKTSDLIPMCHPLPLSKCKITIEPGDSSSLASAGPGLGQPQRLRVQCTATTTGQTGVEMEALTGVTIAALTLYDMLKSAVKWENPKQGSHDREASPSAAAAENSRGGPAHGLDQLVIETVRLLEKTGGKSDFHATLR